MVYNDLASYGRVRKVHNVRSNLCSWFVAASDRFCGNYCVKASKKDVNLRYCWRHASLFRKSEDTLVLIMIVSAKQIFNRNVWKRFIHECQIERVPIHMLIYHELMNNGTVRENDNLISRFRPVPARFGQKCVSLQSAHGHARYMSVYLKLLNYAYQIVEPPDVW